MHIYRVMFFSLSLSTAEGHKVGIEDYVLHYLKESSLRLFFISETWRRRDCHEPGPRVRPGHSSGVNRAGWRTPGLLAAGGHVEAFWPRAQPSFYRTENSTEQTWAEAGQQNSGRVLQFCPIRTELDYYCNRNKRTENCREEQNSTSTATTEM